MKEGPIPNCEKKNSLLIQVSGPNLSLRSLERLEFLNMKG